MLKKEDLTQVSELIDSFKPQLTFFEKQILIPGMRGRLEYAITIFDEFKRICADRNVAIHIDAALRSIVDPEAIKLGVKEPEVGVQYLGAVARQCDEEYIKPLKEMLAKHPLQETSSDMDKATEFLNSAGTFFQTITGVKDKSFQYHLKTFLNIKQTATGAVVLSAPTELTLILMPFQTRMEELINVSTTAIESIRAWAEQITKQKAKHVEIISHLSEVKAAEEQARAAKYNMIFQVAVIIFTIILVIGAERAGIYLEKRDLEHSLLRYVGLT